MRVKITIIKCVNAKYMSCINIECRKIIVYSSMCDENESLTNRKPIMPRPNRVFYDLIPLDYI